MHRFASSGQATDVGHVRAHNEDACRVEPASALLVVADGMGGHVAGEVASQVAVDVVSDVAGPQGRGLGDALAAAHRAIAEAPAQGRGVPGMGTTCVACRGSDHGLAVAWVGDSRAYVYRSGTLEAITRDHSHVQALVDQGRLAPEDAAAHPQRHVLARCLGAMPLERTDVDEREITAGSGDRVLLCTDGLTGELDDGRIAQVLAAHEDDEAAARALVATALEAGGRDNVTAIVATLA